VVGTSRSTAISAVRLGYDVDLEQRQYW